MAEQVDVLDSSSLFYDGNDFSETGNFDKMRSVFTICRSLLMSTFQVFTLGYQHSYQNHLSHHHRRQKASPMIKMKMEPE